LANSELKTLIHELSHALIRRERRGDDPELSRDEEEVVVECVAYTVCASVGLDTSGYSIPYVASWSEGGEIERYAALIDRLAGRLEDAVLAEGAPERGEEVAIADLSACNGGPRGAARDRCIRSNAWITPT
jgi:antirestriction protein ArdC